ncbi:MAG: sulfatase [Nitrospira sp.]|nr:sulfatase [bacterium]MBL7050282.1 sulfatase [Nitrospira sp.]
MKLLILCITLTMMLSVTDSVYSRQITDKPNVILILLDDLGWEDLGIMGHEIYKTPNIDNLAKDGIMFTNAYANAPNCAPSRAAILSGQYTPRHGILTVDSSARGEEHMRKVIPVETKKVLAPEVITIAEALKPFGYINAHIGKWQLGEGLASGPLTQGFDINVGGTSNFPKRYFSPYRNKTIKDGPKGEYLTDRLTDEALQFIDSLQSSSYRARPFFLYMSYFSPHTPYQAKEETIEKYIKHKDSNKHLPTYAAMIDSIDDNIGRLMLRLKELNIADNTTIILLSDNGGSSLTTTGVLRGSKATLYEGGIRVPMIIHGPKSITSGMKCATPVMSTDLYTTILGITGTDRPQGHILDGIDLQPLFSDCAKSEPRNLFWYFPAYIQGPKNTGGEYWHMTPASAVRRGDYKLIEHFEDDSIELFNLANDQKESRNIAAHFPEKTQELTSILRNWMYGINALTPEKK